MVALFLGESLNRAETNPFRFTTVPPRNEIKRSARDMKRQTTSATIIKTTVKITVKQENASDRKAGGADFLGVPGGNRTPDQRIRSWENLVF